MVFLASLQNLGECTRRRLRVVLLRSIHKVPAVFPQLHLRFVDRNLDQPRGEFRFLTETGKVFEGLQDRSLGDILSVRVILN